MHNIIYAGKSIHSLKNCVTIIYLSLAFLSLHYGELGELKMIMLYCVNGELHPSYGKCPPSNGCAYHGRDLVICHRQKPTLDENIDGLHWGISDRPTFVMDLEKFEKAFDCKAPVGEEIVKLKICTA